MADAQLIPFPLDMIVHKATRENTILKVFASCIVTGLEQRGRISDAAIIEGLSKAVAILNKSLEGAKA